MHPRILIAAVSFAFCVSAPRAQGPSDSRMAAARDCIRIEMLMFSGRPRPAYLVCEEGKKEDLVSRLKAAVEKAPAGSLEPFESTPAYQGLLIIEPQGETRVPKRIFVGKGKVGDVDSESGFPADSGRDLERYLLDLGETKTDVSLPGREESLRRLVGEAKAGLDKTN